MSGALSNHPSIAGFLDVFCTARKSTKAMISLMHLLFLEITINFAVMYLDISNAAA